MTSQDIFYFASSISVLVIAGSIAYVAFYAVEALKSLKMNLDNIEDTTKDMRMIKDTVKLGVFKFISNTLGLFLKERR